MHLGLLFSGVMYMLNIAGRDSCGFLMVMYGASVILTMFACFVRLRPISNGDDPLTRWTVRGKK